MMPPQHAPSAVMMVRPHHFTPNPATAADNAFQVVRNEQPADLVARRAYREVTEAAAALRHAGVVVHLFEDQGNATPDSVFPNNWISTHAGGHIALYPLFAPNRRGERRSDIVEMLKANYRVQDVIDYSGLEVDGVYLEGTGAMVLDPIERVAYTARSNRADPVMLERFCTHFNFEPMVFDAADEAGTPIYHTNVMMCIGTNFCLVGLETITSPARRTEIEERLTASGRSVIPLTQAQVRAFAGNALELTATEGPTLILSRTAMDALHPEQLRMVEQHAKLLPIAVPTIEMAGGSIRCMVASIHLSPR